MTSASSGSFNNEIAMDTDNALSEHSLDRTGRREYWTTITNGCNVAEAVKKSIEYLKSRSAQAVSMRLFADEKDLNEASVLLNPTIDEMGSPPLRITQNNPIGSNRIAIQIHAVSGMNSTPLYFEDVCVGRRFEDADAKYYMLNVLSGDTEQSKYIQTKEVFEKIHQMLSSFGLSFSNTIRTWLYASDILSWYDDLNRARNDFFTDHGIYDRIVPASTGIGVDNADHRSLAIQCLASEPISSQIKIMPTHSPLQSSAMDYKSSFSRGISILSSDYHRLSVSGTASIDKNGNTVNIGDTAAQIDLTMRVVEAILKDAEMDWSDAVSSLVYFKHNSDIELFDRYCSDRGISFPHVRVRADVCRDDLLFEVELDAVKSLS